MNQLQRNAHATHARCNVVTGYVNEDGIDVPTYCGAEATEERVVHTKNLFQPDKFDERNVCYCPEHAAAHDADPPKDEKDWRARHTDTHATHAADAAPIAHQYAYERLTYHDPNEAFSAEYVFIGCSFDDGDDPRVTEFVVGDRRYAIIDGEEESEPCAYFDGEEWVDPAHISLPALSLEII